MKRLFMLVGISIFSVLLVSCFNKEENNIPIDSNQSVTSQSIGDKKTLEEKDDLIGLYKTIFKDLFETDEGLNTDITMVAFDFTKAENLTIQDKSTLVYLIGNMTGVETRLATYEELIDEKLISIDKNGIPGSFEKDILVSFEVSNVKENSFNFNVTKWRGPLGAYGFSDCTAKKVGNTWSYKVGAHTIS